MELTHFWFLLSGVFLGANLGVIVFGLIHAAREKAELERLLRIRGI